MQDPDAALPPGSCPDGRVEVSSPAVSPHATSHRFSVKGNLLTPSAGLTVPYITVRHGETPDLERHLCVRPRPRRSRRRLAWINEGLGDRDLRGVLWGRVSQELSVDRRALRGTPRWRLVHPARQRETMLYLQCRGVRDAGARRAPPERVFEMLIKVVKRSWDGSWRSDGRPMAAPGSGVATAADDGAQAAGPAAGLRRDLVAGPTGSPWRDIPERYGPWETSYSAFRRWQIDGTWARVLEKLQVKADAAGHVEWEVSVDSTVCRAHQHAAGARKRGLTVRAGRTTAAWRTNRRTTGSAVRVVA